MNVRRVRYLLAVSLALAIVLPGGRAAAHAMLVRAEPAAGTGHTLPPTEVRLTFDTPLREGSGIQIFKAAFEPVAGVEASISPDNPLQLVARLPELTAGDYTVQWTAVAEDGDETSGSYSFRVFEPEATTLRGWWVVTVVAALLATTWVRRAHQLRRDRGDAE